MASSVAVEKAPDIQPECRHRWIIDGALRVDSNLGNTTGSPASASRCCFPPGEAKLWWRMGLTHFTLRPLGRPREAWY